MTDPAGRGTPELADDPFQQARLEPASPQTRTDDGAA
jgi:hypothetical protein